MVSLLYIRTVEFSLIWLCINQKFYISLIWQEAELLSCTLRQQYTHHIIVQVNYTFYSEFTFQYIDSFILQCKSINWYFFHSVVTLELQYSKWVFLDQFPTLMESAFQERKLKFTSYTNGNDLRSCEGMKEDLVFKK